VADLVKGDLAKTGFNIFRTYWFFQAIYFAYGEGFEVLVNTLRALFVMFPATVVWTIKAIADIGIFYYTQREYVDEGDFSIEPLLAIAIANVFFGSATLLTIFYYNVATIFAGKKFLIKYIKVNNYCTRILFFFPMLFILVCFVIPIILWTESTSKQYYLFYVLFCLAMAANSILTVVVIVGLFSPTWYQNVMFYALGNPELKKEEKEKELEKEQGDL